MTDAVNQAPWRDIRIGAIVQWSPRARIVLSRHFATLGELADYPRQDLHRMPQIGPITRNEIAGVINRAKAGEDLTNPAGPGIPAADEATIDAPRCGTCRWWGHDVTGPWVVSPKAGPINVCGVHRQDAGAAPRCNVVTTEYDWCGEHLPQTPIEDAPSP